MHSSTPGAPAPHVTSIPLAVRLTRSALWIVFYLGLALLAGLALVSAGLGADLGTGVAAVLAPAGLILGLRRLPGAGWTRLAVGYGVLASVVAYLVVDDTTIRRPLTLDAISPTFAGGEQSYEVLMRYGKNHPLGRDFRLKTSDALYRGPGVFRPRDPQWSAWLTANRAELERGWATLEPVRAWWGELNRFERIADLTPPRVDAEIMAFAPVRTLSQHACAIAGLQALDGNGDAAIETLLPILEVSRKLEPSSRTLVRTMIARVMQKLALETAAFVADTTPISPAVRARLAHVLNGGFGGEEGARRLVAMEYAWGDVGLRAESLGDMMPDGRSHRWLHRCLLPISPILFNPRRTLNLYGELMTELENCAANRGAGGMDAAHEKFFARHARYGFKNVAGPLALSWVTPAYKKVVENYWITEDLRSALQLRLQG